MHTQALTQIPSDCVIVLMSSLLRLICHLAATTTKAAAIGQNVTEQAAWNESLACDKLARRVMLVVVVIIIFPLPCLTSAANLLLLRPPS